MMPSPNPKVAVIILAAGLGTRMRSGKAKVLHELHGRPMISYVIDTAKCLGAETVVVVIGNQAEAVRATVSEEHEVFFALQEQQLGTGHAVQCAMPYLPAHIEHALILCGDVPLLRSETLNRLLVDHCRARRHLTLLAAQTDAPQGYGRILLDTHRNVCAIIEEADATKAQKRINVVNTGIYCVNREFLADSLHKINCQNCQRELYLTDIVGVGYTEGRSVGAIITPGHEEFIGVNSPGDLQRVEAIMRAQANQGNIA